MIIANGGHEGIGAEDWIDMNQLKAEAAELFDISRQAAHKALATEPFNLKEKVAIPECGGKAPNGRITPTYHREQ